METIGAPTQFRVQAGDIDFAVLSWGPDDGPLALCLHGYPDTAWTWRHLGPHLAEQGWRVVAPFMRGYAPTSLAPDGSYEVGALARDAIELHSALGGDDRAVLIGHDWGAIAAYVAAASAPTCFSRAVAMAVPPLGVVFGPLTSLAGIRADWPLVRRQLRCSWYVLFQQVPWLPERLLPTVAGRLWADWSPGYEAGEDLRLLASALDSPARRTAALRYYRALMQPWRWRRRYRTERGHLMDVPDVPVLYLHGVRDGCMQVAFGDLAMSTLPVGSRYERVDDAGHFMQLEQPAAVNASIASFVAPVLAACALNHPVKDIAT